MYVPVRPTPAEQCTSIGEVVVSGESASLTALIVLINLTRCDPSSGRPLLVVIDRQPGFTEQGRETD